MNTYTFAKDHFPGIMSHVIAYGLDIILLTLQNDMYTIELTGPIPTEEEYQHLQEVYNFQEIS